MKISLSTIKDLKPCEDRLENFKNNYGEKEFNLEEFLALDKITYSDKIWTVTKFFNKQQSVLWSIKCANSVLHLFEDKHPNDLRPRKAIEAAEAYITNPNKRTETIAASASASAASASAAAYASASAASASAASASAAAYASASAAYAFAASTFAASAAFAASTASAASAASASAYAYAYAAYSAASAASEKKQEELNLKLMLETYNETKEK